LASKKMFGPAGEQRHVRVHAGAVDAVDRFGHERGVEPVAGRDVLDHEPERRDVVRRRQHVVVAEIDFVLAGRDLVVRGFHMEAHRLERQHDLAPDVLAHVDRAQVEVAGAVVRFGGGNAVLGLKEKELRFRSGVQRVALRRRKGDHFFQTGARVAGKRLPVGRVDIADHASDVLAAGARPRKHAKRREVRAQVHVGLFNPHEALDRRSVKHDLAVERLLRTAGRGFRRS
jgi:hypothetical protein